MVSVGGRGVGWGWGGPGSLRMRRTAAQGCGGPNIVSAPQLQLCSLVSAYTTHYVLKYRQPRGHA